MPCKPHGNLPLFVTIPRSLLQANEFLFLLLLLLLLSTCAQGLVYNFCPIPILTSYLQILILTPYLQIT